MISDPDIFRAAKLVIDQHGVPLVEPISFSKTAT
jgi:hypothetical protein